MINKVTQKTAKAKLRAIKISPQKLNLVAETIRGLKVEKALAELQFSKKRVAVQVRKLLLSAIANAENNHNMDVDKLIVKEAYVGKAMVMKRFIAMARGRSGRIEKPFSNMTIVVAEAQASVKAAKKTEKKETEATPKKPVQKKTTGAKKTVKESV